jgi:hypothetical protein
LAIWVNISHDCAKTFGPLENVLANFAVGCNRVSAGAAIENPGVHPGPDLRQWLCAWS